MKHKTLDILLKKFPANEYALMPEVRDKAGSGASRSADFLVMGLWPSRGLDMIGIERKSYRGDWLKELKTPAKAENIFQYCDRWYLLTDNDNVAKIEEIPSNWGWMHIDIKGKLNILKEAPKLNPAPVSKSFLACLLKRASSKDGWITIASIEDKIAAAKEEGLKERNYNNQSILQRYQELVKDVKDFEEATGVNLLNLKYLTTGKRVGEAVRFVLDGGIDSIKRQMDNIKKYHSAIGTKIAQFEQVESRSITID